MWGEELSRNIPPKLLIADPLACLTYQQDSEAMMKPKRRLAKGEWVKEDMALSYTFQMKVEMIP